MFAKWDFSCAQDLNLMSMCCHLFSLTLAKTFDFMNYTILRSTLLALSKLQYDHRYQFLLNGFQLFHLTAKATTTRRKLSSLFIDELATLIIGISSGVLAGDDTVSY